MDVKEKLSIRVNVADRYYPLKIDRKDEERIRKAAKRINEKLIQYKQRYIDKDSQDFLAMASLQFVTQVLDYEDKHDMEPLEENIMNINQELSDYINSIKK